MRAHENTPALTDIIGDADIHRILDEQLIPWDTGHRNTEKFQVAGMPEVVIRHNADDFRSLQHAQEVASLFNELPSHDIPTLPYVVTEHNDKIYAVTRMLHGHDILSLARPNAPPKMHSMIDRQWTRIIDYNRRARQKNHPAAADISKPGQYMYGKTCNDSEDSITLVDLGTLAFDFHKQRNNHAYEGMLFHGVRFLLGLESRLGKCLSMSRLAIEEALDTGYDFLAYDTPSELRQAYLWASRYMLRRQVDVLAMACRRKKRRI